MNLIVNGTHSAPNGAVNFFVIISFIIGKRPNERSEPLLLVQRAFPNFAPVRIFFSIVDICVHNCQLKNKGRSMENMQELSHDVGQVDFAKNLFTFPFNDVLH